MKKAVLTSFTILCLSSTVLLVGLALNTQSVRAEPKTWTVDDSGGADFTQIQDAIDAADTGDTIIVNEGYYLENQIDVFRSVTLIANGTVVVDNFHRGHVFHVMADQVTICGFTVLNSRYEYSFAGIYITSQENNITKNDIRDNFKGIYAYDSSYNSISKNSITKNYHGVYLERYSSVNNIDRNNIGNNSYGIIIRIEDAMGIGIYENNVVNNDNHGILVDGSSQTFVVRNNITNNGSNGITFFVSSTCIVEENNITSNHSGIALEYSTNINIFENLVAFNNHSGIFFTHSELSGVDENHIWKNNYGVYIKDGSYRIDLHGNTLQENEYGVLLEQYSTDSIIIGNSISSNQKGVFLSYSSNNYIVHNNFFNNTIPVCSSNSLNTWDDLEGNFWSDYKGPDDDRDGLGDQPYIIDEYNEDGNPLLGPFCSFRATHGYPVTIICNSTISGLQFNGSAISFDVTGEDGTAGFCRICIPKVLIDGTYQVFVNGSEVLYELLPCSDLAYSYLYFTYDHSTKEIVIVPEFSSILLLFVVVTLLSAIFLRKCMHALF